MEEGPGLVVLFGSGERAPGAQRIYDWVMQRLSPPIRISILETPAGFELNSDLVGARVGDFIRDHLPNYNPAVQVLPARKKGTPNSPDNPDVVAPMLHSNVIFMGPGSPTYAIRQLRDSLAWQMLLARHHLGAALILASAATISISRCALPVYEIFKVGADPFWNEGLDFWGAYGLSLALIPHWDNSEGGEELDTSHCFMGKARFDELMRTLPAGVVTVGIDEHTALIMDAAAGRGYVLGRGGVTVLAPGELAYYRDGETLPLSELGPFEPTEPLGAVRSEIWSAVRDVGQTPIVPAEVEALAEERERARRRKEWSSADELRTRIEALGWQVADTRDGPRLQPK